MKILKAKLEIITLRDYTDDSKVIFNEIGVNDKHDENDE